MRQNIDDEQASSYADFQEQINQVQIDNSFRFKKMETKHAKRSRYDADEESEDNDLAIAARKIRKLGRGHQSRRSKSQKGLEQILNKSKLI